jgi:serine/threonine-protein kinase RsbW
MSDKRVLTFPGRYEKIKQICQFVAHGAAQAGLDETAIFHVELACDEACTNIIEHAYGGEDVGEIIVSWHIKGSQFTVTLHDNGRSFDPENVPPPPIPADNPSEADVEKLKVGGLGIHFMRNLMDEVTFEFDQKKGNTLTLVKKISKG